MLTTSADLAADVTGVLPVANGGNGTGTFTDGQILIGQTTGNTLSKKSVNGAVSLDKDGLAVVVRSICIVPFTSAEAVTVGDGTIGFAVPANMNGLRLTAAMLAVHDAGSGGGTTDVQVRRRRAGASADMLTTKITLSPSTFTASSVSVETANDDLQTGDLIYVDVDAINFTAPSGLSVTLTFDK